MTRRVRKSSGIPVLKLPPQRLSPVLLALRDNEFDRAGFRDAVLDIFAGDSDGSFSEKSVFRGMAIPTLRALGLLLGFETTLELSADGALAAAGARSKAAAPMAAILIDIEDEKSLGFTLRGTESAALVVDKLCSIDGQLPESRRRAQRWLAYLEHFGVVETTDGKLRRVAVAHDIDLQDFQERLRAAYRLITRKAIGEPTVTIDEIAKKVALSAYEKGVIITRRQFDNLLRQGLESRTIAVHLHRSMGAAQRLFQVGATYYESLSFRRDDRV
jgi:hypothetical protein